MCTRPSLFRLSPTVGREVNGARPGTSPESQNSASKADLAGPPEAMSDRAENHDTSIPVVCSLDLSIYSDGLGLSVKPSPPPCAPEAWPQVGRPSSPATLQPGSPASSTHRTTVSSRTRTRPLRPPKAPNHREPPLHSPRAAGSGHGSPFPTSPLGSRHVFKTNFYFTIVLDLQKRCKGSSVPIFPAPGCCDC